MPRAHPSHGGSSPEFTDRTTKAPTHGQPLKFFNAHYDTVNITYLVGSRLEAYGETGMAHLLEHVMFKGSARHHNVLQLLQERGGQANGSTWYDRTNYFETLPASHCRNRLHCDIPEFKRRGPA